jgi:hypothetical protein
VAVRESSREPGATDERLRSPRRDAGWHTGAELDPVRAWRLGWDVQVTADIIPCTRSEFDEEKHEIDSLPRAAVLRGRKLYER